MQGLRKTIILDSGAAKLVKLDQENRAFEVAAIEAGVIEEVERTPEAVEASLDLLAAFANLIEL